MSSAVSVLTLILKQPVPSLPLLSTPNLTTISCNSLYYHLPRSQINHLQQNSELSCSLTLKLQNFLTSRPSSDLCTGSRLTYALNINSCHLPIKFSQSFLVIVGHVHTPSIFCTDTVGHTHTCVTYKLCITCFNNHHTQH